MSIENYIMDSMQSPIFSYDLMIFIDRDRLTIEIDNEIDQSSVENFLLAMLSKERTRRSPGRKAGLRILRTPITVSPTGNRFFLYRYQLLDTAFFACKIALRRQVSNSARIPRKVSQGKEQSSVEINAREEDFLEDFTDLIDIERYVQTP